MLFIAASRVLTEALLATPSVGLIQGKTDPKFSTSTPVQFDRSGKGKKTYGAKGIGISKQRHALEL